MKTIQKAIDVIFSLGAAVVIYGALLKITHKAGADIMLSIGLYTEVGIFVIMGVQEFFKKPEPKQVVPGATADTSQLVTSIDTLTRTIKKIFNA